MRNSPVFALIALSIFLVVVPVRAEENSNWDTLTGYARDLATAGEQADLSISDLRFSPSTINVGASPGATCYTIANNGPADLETPDTCAIIAFYLSKNTTFGDSDDVPFTGPGNITADLTLNSGESSSLVINGSALGYLKVPAVSPGKYYVFVRVDHHAPSTLTDPDTSNNYTRTSEPVDVVNLPDVSYSLYRANLHVHTNYSSPCELHTCVGNPLEILGEARDIGLDVIGMSDHNLCGDQDGIDSTEWDQLEDAANNSSQNPCGYSLGLRGFEWTWKGKFDSDHINLFGSAAHFPHDQMPASDATPAEGMAVLYDWLGSANANAQMGYGERPVGQFNHVGHGTHLNGFAGRDRPDFEELDSLIQLIEIGCGQETPLPSPFSWWTVYDLHRPVNVEPQLKLALTQGWHVAPTIGVDFHWALYYHSLPEEARKNHTGVWAASRSRADIMEALCERRVFASEDQDILLKFTCTIVGRDTYWMGQVVEVTSSDTCTFNIYVEDPDGEKIDEVALISACDPTSVREWSDWNSSTFNNSHTVKMSTLDRNVTDLGEYSFYVRVKTNDDDYIYSAPIWLKWTRVCVDQDAPGPVHDGRTWQTAFTTVQEGLDAAGPGAEVWVAAHTYMERVTMEKRVKLLGGFSGVETSPAERDWRRNLTVIDGGGSGPVVTLSPPAGSEPEGWPQPAVDGFTIRGGGGAAGIEVNCDCPVINNNTVTGNGAGVHWRVFTGGRISHNVISQNRSIGGILLEVAADVVIDNNLILGNAGHRGGGIACAPWSGAPAQLLIVHNTVVGNQAYWGGGIFAGGNSRLTVFGNIFDGNFSIEPGANITAEEWGQRPLVVACSFWNWQGLPFSPANWNPIGVNGNFSTDPMLSDGCRLASGSPCIDKIDSFAYCQNYPYCVFLEPPEVDLDGLPRRVGSLMDIGCYEWPHCLADSFEDDQPYARATTIVPGVSHGPHSICPVNDLDCVAFTIAERSFVTIETRGTEGGNTELWLRQWVGGSNYPEVAHDYDSGEGAYSRISAGLEPGTYYATVGGGNQRIGEYYIDLTVEPGYLVSGQVRSRWWPNPGWKLVEVTCDAIGGIYPGGRFWTDSNGGYSLILPAGEHMITAGGHVTCFWAEGESGAASQIIDVTSDTPGVDFWGFSTKAVPEAFLEADREAALPGQTVNVTVGLRTPVYACWGDSRLDLSFDDAQVAVETPVGSSQWHTLKSYAKGTPIRRVDCDRNWEDVPSTEYLVSAIRTGNFIENTDCTFIVPLTVNLDATPGTLTLKYRGTIVDRRDPVSSCSGILDQQGLNVYTKDIPILPSAVSVPEAKRKSDGDTVCCGEALVSATFPGCFYLESDDRSSGIRVESSFVPAIGDRCVVQGVLQTDDAGERSILASAVHKTGSALPIEPLGLSNYALGGTDWWHYPGGTSGQHGVMHGGGLNNIGLLVRCWGRVMSMDPGDQPKWFMLDDGSGVAVRCDIPDDIQTPCLCLPIPMAECEILRGAAVQESPIYVEVTGISRLYVDGGDYKRRISPRDADDLVVLSQAPPAP